VTPKQSADTRRSEQLKEVRTRAHSFRRLGRTAAAGGYQITIIITIKKKSNGSGAFFFLLLPLLMMTADGEREKKTAEFDSFVARGERATAATTDHKSADFFFSGRPFFPLTGRLGT
jgi:hypothetical protein